MDANALNVSATPAGQVGGRAVSLLKSWDRNSRDRRVAEMYAAKSPIVPTLGQLAQMAGTSPARVSKALNGSRPKRAPAPAMAELAILLSDLAETALRIQWRNADVERSALAELDRLFGVYLQKHGTAIGVWRDRGGTAPLLERAVRSIDRLITTILANNNLA